MDVGKRIRELRELNNMTQEELAHKVGYKSRVSINKIELQRDVPIKKVLPIANALGISPEELMGWDKEIVIDESKIPQLSPMDIEVLMLFSKLTKEQKENFLNLLRSVAESN